MKHASVPDYGKNICEQEFESDPLEPDTDLLSRIRIQIIDSMPWEETKDEKNQKHEYSINLSVVNCLNEGSVVAPL